MNNHEDNSLPLEPEQTSPTPPDLTVDPESSKEATVAPSETPAESFNVFQSDEDRVALDRMRKYTKYYNPRKLREVEDIINRARQAKRTYSEQRTFEARQSILNPHRSLERIAQKPIVRKMRRYIGKILVHGH